MYTTRWRSAPQKDWSQRVRVRGPMLLMAWVEFLGRVPWKLFVTLTFDPKRIFPVSCRRVEKEALAWCGHVGWATRQPVAWLIAPERGGSGLWHAHVLLAGVPRDLSALAAMWRMRNGHVKVKTTTDAIGAVLYSTKEAALSGEIVLSGTLSRYRCQLTHTPRFELYPASAGEHRIGKVRGWSIPSARDRTLE